MDYQRFEWQSETDRSPELDALVEAYIKRCGLGSGAAPQGTYYSPPLDVDIGFEALVRDLTENAG